MVWGTSVAAYLFLAGVSAGALFLVLAGVLKARAGGAAGVAGVLGRRVGLAVSFAALVAGTLFLVLDARGGLTNPAAFLGMLSNAASPMSWGTAVIGLTLAVQVAALVALWNDGARAGRAGGAVAVAGVVLAVLLASYTGVLLGVASPVALWSGGLLALLFLVSSLVSGAAAVLLVLAAVRRAEAFALAEATERYLVGLSATEAVLLFVHLLTTATRGAAGAASVASLVSGVFAPAFWLALVAAGLAFPLAAGLLSLSGRVGGTVRYALQLAGYAGTLVGAFTLRVLVVAAGVPTFVSAF